MGCRGGKSGARCRCLCVLRFYSVSFVSNLLTRPLKLRTHIHRSESNDRRNSRNSNATSRSSSCDTSTRSHRRASSRTGSRRRPENQTEKTHHASLRRKRRQRQALLRPSKTLVRLSKRNRSPRRQKSRNLSLRILPDNLQTRPYKGPAKLHDSLLRTSRADRQRARELGARSQHTK
jgi:hypothetical protein